MHESIIKLTSCSVRQLRGFVLLSIHLEVKKHVVSFAIFNCMKFAQKSSPNVSNLHLLVLWVSKKPTELC